MFNFVYYHILSDTAYKFRGGLFNSENIFRGKIMGHQNASAPKPYVLLSGPPPAPGTPVSPAPVVSKVTITREVLGNRPERSNYLRSEIAQKLVDRP